MGRRRSNDGIKAIAGLVFLVLLVFGGIVVTFIKLITSILAVILAIALLALAGYGCYRLGRYWWNRKLDLEAHMPVINWSLPNSQQVDSTWSDILYPKFPDKTIRTPAHIIGTSGAWKDVLRMLEGFPAFQTAASPSDLKQRVQVYQAAAKSILADTEAQATKTADGQKAQMEEEIKRLQSAHQPVELRIRAQLDRMASNVKWLSGGGFWDRRRARHLNSILSMSEIQLHCHIREIKGHAKRQEQAIRDFLNPDVRAEMFEAQIQEELRRLNEITSSKEFAGAVAEMTVIEELSRLPTNCHVINDLKLHAPRYIHNQGKPIQSAQIDTLVITTAGVFVVEVKNWSRGFTESGEGFSPFEQVSRARYLVSVMLKEAGLDVKVRAIVTTQGSLPEKGEAKVAVKPLKQLRSYVMWFEPAGVDVQRVSGVIQQSAR
jgi:hypothetical protein